jgi:uncharacterized protein (TIGR02246 family)
LQADAETRAAVVALLETFCSRFEARDADGVLALFASDAGVAMITSEDSLVRGREQLTAFLRDYAQGGTTYSWAWNRHDVSVAGSVAWLLAEGVETAAGPQGTEQHRYRMTLVCEKRGDRWLLMQIHGSSPHGG